MLKLHKQVKKEREKLSLCSAGHMIINSASLMMNDVLHVRLNVALHDVSLIKDSEQCNLFHTNCCVNYLAGANPTRSAFLSNTV